MCSCGRGSLFEILALTFPLNIGYIPLPPVAYLFLF